MKYSIYILLAILSLNSCTKIIDIELNSAMQRLVIEAKITDEGGPATVIITRSTDYFYPDEPVKVSGAKVSLRTESGELEMLQETSEGKYESSRIRGSWGEKYFLKVEDGEQVYEATSTLPVKVIIDTLEFELFDTFTPHGSSGGYILNCKFTDPPDQGNFYTFNATRISENPIENTDPFAGPSIILVNDQYINGLQSSVNLNRHDFYQTGDTILVELTSIDQNVYNYLDQLNEIIGMGAMFSSSAPANPENNISNGAMGYFTAEAVDSRIVVVK